MQRSNSEDNSFDRNMGQYLQLCRRMFKKVYAKEKLKILHFIQETQKKILNFDLNFAICNTYGDMLVTCNLYMYMQWRYVFPNTEIRRTMFDMTVFNHFIN